jgi:hypothetical protein
MNRIRRSFAIALLVVAATACKKTQAKETPAAKPAESPATTTPTAAPAPAPDPAPAAETPPAAPAAAAESLAPQDSPCTATATGKLADSAAGETLIEVKLKNTSKKAWHYCNIYGFAYDKAGKLVGRGGLSENRGVKPGEEYLITVRIKDDADKPLKDPASLVYETVVSDVYFDDKTEWKEPKLAAFMRTAPTTPTVAIKK